jgi:septum formation protein
MNYSVTTPIILASASPRRSSLLAQVGIPFEVEVSGVPEDTSDELSPSDLARSLALSKANAVASRQEESGRIVLGADSIVVVDGIVFGKPTSRSDARHMLETILGRKHQVITGIALVESGTGRQYESHEETEVTMRAATEDEIRQYLATGESMDKAGAYGAQGFGAGFIERVNGCFYNVVGLPLSLVITSLRTFTGAS